MAFNPGHPGPGFPYFPPNPYFPRPPPQPQAPPPPQRFPPPIRAPPPPQRAPPPPQPPLRAPPPPALPPPPPRRAPPPPALPPPPPRRAPPPPSLPPPPPRRAPPPPASTPPPPRRAPPPPSPPIRSPPPPTPRPFAPPPPHILPPPTPVPPPPGPPHHIVIIVVFVSLGGLLLLGCLAAFFCWHKKRGRKTETKAQVLNYSDHVHVHKETMAGPHDADVVKLSIDEDIKFQDAVKKQDAIGESSSTATAGKKTAHHHLPWTWHKKHESKEEKKIELINVTKHKHVDEKIMPGPHGEKIEVLSEDEDIRFEEAGQDEEEFEKSKARTTKS